MTKSNKLLIGGIGILVLIGFALGVFGFIQGLQESQNGSGGQITSFEECAAAGYPVGESHPRQCWTPDGKHFVEDIGDQEEPAATPITVRGEIVCLPKRGAGAQTLECAIGLQGQADDLYYALENLSEYGFEFQQTGARVNVAGTFTEEERLGPDGNPYNIAGVIAVTSIEKL